MESEHSIILQLNLRLLMRLVPGLCSSQAFLFFSHWPLLPTLAAAFPIYFLKGMTPIDCFFHPVGETGMLTGDRVLHPHDLGIGKLVFLGELVFATRKLQMYFTVITLPFPYQRHMVIFQIFTM